MAFNYIGDLSTDRDRVRFHIADTVSGSGPRPAAGTASNFTDAEVDGVLSDEGSFRRAIASMFETLSGEYAYFVDISVGPRRESLGQAAARYRALAIDWRKKYGDASSSVSSNAFTRVDGHSGDIKSNAV